MAFMLKIHRSPEGIVASCCDSDILGQRFEQEGIVLDVSPEFFSGEECGIDEIKQAISTSQCAIIAGNRIIDALIEACVLSENCTKEVAGVRHAQIFRI